MARSNNLYIILILQAIITILLFFSEGVMKYITVGLFCIFDIIIFAGLLGRQWRSAELFSFTTLFYSVLFLIFYWYAQSNIGMIIGVGLMLLFLLSALLLYEPQPKVPKRLPELAKPSKPDSMKAPDYEPVEKYDIDKLEKEIDQELRSMQKAEKTVQKELKPELVTAKEDAKFKARALAYELEREAAELKRAEAYVRRKETTVAQDELEREAAELQKAEQYLELEDLKSKENELVREAVELKKADSYLKRKDKSIRTKELEREAKALEDAEKQIKQVEFLNKQEQVIKEVKKLAQAQKKIDTIKRPKSKINKKKR